MESGLDYFTTTRRNVLLVLGTSAAGGIIVVLTTPALNREGFVVALGAGVWGHIALLWNERWPRTVAAVAIATSTLTAFAAPAVWAMLFLIGLRFSIRTASLFVAAGVLPVIVLFASNLWRWEPSPSPGLTALVAALSVLMTIGAGGTGIATGIQLRRNIAITDLFLSSLRRELRASERATQAERNRIAQTLHDDLGHNLALINLFVSSMECTHLNDEEMRDALATIRDQNRAASRSLTAAISGLTNGPASVPFADQLGKIVAEVRRAGLAVSADLRSRVSLSPHQASFVLRVVREGLTNAVRYAEPRRARVQVEIDEERSIVRILVASTYSRSGAQRETNSNRSGILRLKRDAESFGGAVTFNTSRGIATLKCTLPLIRIEGSKKI